MDVFTTSATAVSVLAALVTIISKLAAARVERRRDHTIADMKWWAGSDDGRHWIRGYVAEWAEARAVGAGQAHPTHPTRQMDSDGGRCNNHGYRDNDEES